MDLGKYLIDFLVEDSKDLTIYYPGLHRKVTGYEIDFRRIIKEMKANRPSLDIQTAGVTVNRIYQDPSYTGNRIKDFDRIEINDLYNIRYNSTEKDIIYLPQPEKWKQSLNSEPASDIKKLINKIKTGGIIITDSKLPERYQDYMYLTILQDTRAIDIKRVCSRKHGEFFVIKI